MQLNLLRPSIDAILFSSAYTDIQKIAPYYTKGFFVAHCVLLKPHLCTQTTLHALWFNEKFETDMDEQFEIHMATLFNPNNLDLENLPSQTQALYAQMLLCNEINWAALTVNALTHYKPSSVKERKSLKFAKQLFTPSVQMALNTYESRTRQHRTPIS